MTPQELKNSILQLAVQGRLVEQRPEEGTAEELYRQIQEEKQRLIKEGKIKKEKPLPEITEDEVPFDIPESWKWVRMAEIIDVRDGTHDTPKYVTDGVPLVTSKNLVNGRIDYESAKMISHQDADMINLRSAVNDNDILFAMIGTIGNPVLVEKDREFVIKNMALFKPINEHLFDMNYLLLFLNKEQFDMKKKASGGVQSFVSLKFLRHYLFPFPPLAEQKRIVAKIEELLPYFDRYEKAWSKLEDFNKRFPGNMQKSVLQMAIQGRLVEQRPKEGTGEELYKQIQAEKQKLIAEGKIKKEKSLPEITDEEIPFDIPDTWKWVRLGEIILSVADGPHFSPQYQDSGVPFISTRNVADGVLDFTSAKYISQDLHRELCKRCKPKKGDVLYTKGGTTGVAVVNDSDIEFNVWVHVAVLSLGSYIYPYYLAMTLNSPHCYELSQKYTHGTSNRDLGLTRMIKITLPLPPLAEQKRIVQKLEEILPLCEKLK